MFNRRKSGVDVVDFTMLEKIRKRNSPSSKTESQQQTPSVGGFLDFTSPAPQSTHTAAPSDSATFGFLSDFAQSSSANGSDVTARLSSPDAEVSALKLKLDDLEYKLERLLERLSEMETKISRA